MANKYSFLADLLNKFHTSSAIIQALWLIAIPVMIFGIFWCLKEAIISFNKRKKDKSEDKGKLLYTVYQDEDKKLSIYKHSEVTQNIENLDNMIFLPSDGEKQFKKQ